MDIASKEGFPYEREDFGQTLATWGVGHGAYLMVPLFGPSSARDFSAEFVDGYFDPLNLYLFNIDEEEYFYIRFGVGTVALREQLLDILDDLRNNSFDYYAALRSAYFQNRASQVRDRGTDFVGPEIPDYDDF